MEEAQGETFIWQELKENFIKDFRFIPKDTKLDEAIEQIKTFIQLTIHRISTQNHNRLKASCNNIQSNRIPQSTRLRLENENTQGKIFQWKNNHPETIKLIKKYSKLSQLT